MDKVHCDAEKSQEHNMSLDWYCNAQRAKASIWVVQVYQHDLIADETILISETGAPSEELAVKWAEMTVDFWSGEMNHIPQPNAGFFIPDVYLVPHKTYTYSINERKGDFYGYHR